MNERQLPKLARVAGAVDRGSRQNDPNGGGHLRDDGVSSIAAKSLRACAAAVEHAAANCHDRSIERYRRDLTPEQLVDAEREAGRSHTSSVAPESLADCDGQRRRRRILAEMLRIALALLLALALAACGTHASKRSATFQANLRITVWPRGKAGTSVKLTLVCPSRSYAPAGTPAVCAKLSRVDSSVFAPVPAGTACTEIYGGPQLASVRGTLDGSAIDARFNRSDGCEIERWQTLGFLLNAVQ